MAEKIWYLEECIKEMEEVRAQLEELKEKAPEVFDDPERLESVYHIFDMIEEVFRSWDQHIAAFEEYRRQEEAELAPYQRYIP